MLPLGQTSLGKILDLRMKLKWQKLEEKLILRQFWVGLVLCYVFEEGDM